MAIFRLLNLLFDVINRGISQPLARRAEAGYGIWVEEAVERLRREGGTVQFTRAQKSWAYRAVKEGHLMLAGDDKLALPPQL